MGKLVAVLKPIALVTLPVGVLLIESRAFKPTGNHVSAVELRYGFATGDALADTIDRIPLADVLRKVAVSLSLT